MTIAVWELILALLGTSGVGALIPAIFSWRKNSAEARESDASAQKVKADAAQILVDTAINNIVAPLTARVNTLEAEVNRMQAENGELSEKVLVLESDKSRTAIIIETLSFRLTKAVGHIVTLNDWIEGLALNVEPPAPPHDIWGEIEN